MFDVQPKPFFAALILAPLLPALPAFGILALLEAVYIPVLTLLAISTLSAVVIRGPIYVVVGGFIAWRSIRRFGPKAPLPAIAFAANLLMTVLIFPVMLWLAPGQPVYATAFIVGFGCIFAPLWAAIGGGLYRKLSAASA